MEEITNEEHLKRIHWLASYPKSGNTWVRLLLYAYQFGTVGLHQMKGHIPSDQIPGAWFAASPVPWGLLTDDQRMLMRHSALMITITMNIQETCILKTHCANVRYNSIDLIPEELTGPSIYLIRDPRDVVISYAHHMGISIDDSIEKMGSIGCLINGENSGIMQPTGTWTMHVTSWLKAGHFKREMIRYEDLQTQPEMQLHKIIEHLYGEHADEDRVRKAVQLCKFEKLKRMEQAEGFREASHHGEFFRAGESTWRDILTDKQVRQIEKDHGECMVEAGYDLEYNSIKGVA